MAAKKRGLGRGLDALIPQATGPEVPGVMEVPVDRVFPNPYQPRQAHDAEALRELAESIREHGVLQPLIVTEVRPDDPLDPPRYQLVTGERRWRAAQLAGLQTVPVLVKETTPQQMLELALVENIQRADLSPLEEAQAYAQLMEEFGLTQEQVAARVGKSRAAVANTVRLLRLPQAVKEALAAGEITEGHARALLALPEERMQRQALEAIRKRGLNVRQTEALVRRLLQPARPAPPPEPETRALEDRLRAALGTPVRLHRGRKGGRLVIRFFSDEELQAIYERLVGPEESL
ncbi:MAG: ParB/RepB/Spo0J family partition protein [Anaerolineae bacterium]|nr:ParB/RepB/Spo0J family partition protein [Anaerolineae bacterium]